MVDYSWAVLLVGRRWRVLAGPIVVIVFLLAGCSGPDVGLDSSAPSTGGTVVIEGDAGEELEVPVTNETGAIVGEVLTDAGFGLPDARVTVIGAPKSVVTNETGWFRVLDVPPGERMLRAEAKHYNPAESEIIVEAGKAKRVTVTMVPVEAQAGYRPHTHDYWGEATEVTVIDSTEFAFYGSPRTTYDHVGRTVAMGTAGSVPSRCVANPGETERPSGHEASRFFFDGPGQTVWPGTRRIDIVVGWSETDYISPWQDVAVAWRHAGGTAFNLSGPIEANVPFSIDVEPTMSDSGHSPFSLWQFYLCIKGQEADDGPGRYFLGDYRIDMTLVRGDAIPLEPPHPRFWSDNETIRVVNGTRVFACPSSDSPTQGNAYCAQAARDSRAEMYWIFRVSPDSGSIVPPGTDRLLAKLSWSYNGVATAGSKPLSVTYSPTSVAPWLKDLEESYRIGELVDEGPNQRTYQIPVEPADTDQFYQRVSNWEFLWGLEGQEQEPSWTHPCACAIEVNLVVDAIRGTGGE